MAESPHAETLDVGIPGSGATGFSVNASAEPILAAEQLREVLEGDFRLSDHWIERAPGFFTRIALYKDGRDSQGRPLDVDESNARLEETFGPALAELKAFLERELDAEVEWGQGLPLPGFHVFDATALRPAEPTGDAHFDTMHHLSYEPGKPCLIRPLPLHRIGTTPRVEPSDYRITLQGHAVRLGERWVAYW
jgi:hypothetical protein